MSDFFHYLVMFCVVIVIGSFVLMLRWLTKTPLEHSGAPEGEELDHEYDGITEYNNPLPAWWVTMSWALVIFSVFYLIMYPGFGRFEGLLGWTSEKELATAKKLADDTYGPIYAEMAKVPVEELQQYPEAMETGRRLFLNNCAVCHGTAATGFPGFPNLTDGAWIHGGAGDQIKSTIVNGKNNMMPPMAAGLGDDPKRIKAVALYVKSLSDHSYKSQTETNVLAKGQKDFATVCSACHGADAGGNPMLGAPNLTDNAWLYGGEVVDIEHTITQGRHGVMPSFKQALGEDRIHVVAAYIYSLNPQSEAE